jgi:hypothetical protein
MTNVSNQKVFMFHCINLLELIINFITKSAIPGYNSEPDICYEEQLIMVTGLKRVELL